MTATTRFVDAEPSIHLEPHFAVVRNFDELKTILDNIANPDSMLPNMVNVPVPENMLGSSINRVPTDYLTASPRNSANGASSTVFPAEPDLREPASSASGGAKGDDQGSPDSGGTTTADTADMGSPLIDFADATSTPPQPKRRTNRILCVWDVDDTLVASGTSGVRQHAIFREAQMKSLFRNLEKAGNVRHLLLSQGSIDDVFAKDGSGRLRYLQKYFFSEENGKDDEDEDEGKSGFGGIFACGPSKTKKKPSELRNPGMVNRNTQVVRLSRIHGEPISESDVAWLAGDGRKAPTVENGSLASRWLFVRPSLAGISLCSLNTPVQPSPYTAFVDGKALRKLDVVWSLAVSGNWDNVFFIDNNLSEVGAVTNNMQMSHLFDLQSDHKESRFFHNELSMLAVSSVLRALCYEHGRDVTVPPSNGPPTADAITRAAKARALFTTPRNGAGSKAELPASSQQTMASHSKESGTEHFLPLTPSSTGADSPLDAVNEPTQPRPAQANRHTDPTSINGSIFVKPKPVAADALSSAPLASGDNGVAAPRVVRLVVANLHLPYDVYKKLLTSRSSTTEDGSPSTVVVTQRNVTRRPNNMAQAHYRGHPLFNKDTSCTDDQYESIIRMFRQHMAYILDLMIEDVRQQGYILINPASKYPADIAQVMLRAYRVPPRIPCIKAPYQQVCRDIERNVLLPLQKGGGNKEGVSVLKSAAHGLFQRLVQTSPLVDPLVIGGLCSSLVEIYLEEGGVTKSQTNRLETQLHHVLLPPA